MRLALYIFGSILVISTGADIFILDNEIICHQEAPLEHLRVLEEILEKEVVAEPQEEQPTKRKSNLNHKKNRILKRKLNLNLKTKEQMKMKKNKKLDGNYDLATTQIYARIIEHKKFLKYK